MKKSLALLASLLSVASAWAGYETIPDVRVEPLLSSHWGQMLDSGYSNVGDYCFNYYTPDHAPCGCSATAFAQILRYWCYPLSYDWANMPAITTNGTSLAQRQAIGRLTYDSATAIHSEFAVSGTSAYTSYVPSAYTKTFGYAQACLYIDKTMSAASLEDTICASLDYGAPVFLAIETDEEGDGYIYEHAAVVDGYGYWGGTRYFHINAGYCNLFGSDAWNPLDTIQIRDHRYTTIQALVYDIFPQATGSVLSGRVTDRNGTAVPDVTVTAYRGSSAVAQTVTDAKGIYAFALPGGVTYKVRAGDAELKVALRAAVGNTVVTDATTGLPAYKLNGVLGNSWGNDLVISTADPQPVDPEPGEEEDTGLGAFWPTKAVSGKAPFAGALYGANRQVVGTVALKIGKVSATKGVSKVSGTITMLDGKKYSIKSTSVTCNAAKEVSCSVTVTKLGTAELKLGEKGFSGTLTGDGETYSLATCDLTKGLSGTSGTFSLDGALPETVVYGKKTYRVLTDCSPTGETFAIAKNKWTFAKAATVKYVKNRTTKAYELTVDTSKNKTNLSGLKLTYTAKTGIFKGSFHLYASDESGKTPKIKKYTVKVNGIVVDGAGVGTAASTKPALSLGVSVK